MTTGADLPGPAPLPPADFNSRPLATATIATGTTLYRIHHTAMGVLYFGPRTEPGDRGRWDAPDDSYGICYLAQKSHIAFCETLLRDLERDDLSQQGDLSPRSLAQLKTNRPLVLAQMHGRGLRRMKATSAVVQGSYNITWAWSRALYNHPDSVDGILYRARHDNDDLSIALFSRAENAVEIIRSTPLLDLSLQPSLGEWLDYYDLGLMP